jgi:hypothetical protein
MSHCIDNEAENNLRLSIECYEKTIIRAIIKESLNNNMKYHLKPCTISISMNKYYLITVTSYFDFLYSIGSCSDIEADRHLVICCVVLI